MSRVWGRGGRCVAGVLLLYGVAALGGRRTTDSFEIHPDHIDGGGSRRQSDSYWLRDVVASPQPGGVARSSTYESRGGYTYLAADVQPGDLDGNGQLDAHDLFLFSLSWQSQPGEPAYRLAADLVQRLKDPQVDEEDLLQLMRFFRVRE